MRTWIAAITTFAITVWTLGAALGGAEEKDRPSGAGSDSRATPAAKPPAEKTSDASAKKQPGKGSRLTVYVPPSRGAVGARTGGGTRGTANAPRIAVLVPDHIGLTTREHPTLAWFLSADTDVPVELTLIADGAVEPAIVTRLRGPQRAGIHLVDLSEYSARLDLGKTYDWYIALVLDPAARDSDVVAGGAIQRSAAAPELAKDLASGEPSYRALARHGIWYDAIADLSKAIAASPPDSAAGQDLRAERAALLEQVGVGAVALYDREEGHELGRAD
jgi:hypothetical protein